VETDESNGGKIDNNDEMIGLNRPRPFIFIGWEDLPCKQCFTTRNHKLLILPEIGETQLDHPWGAVRLPGTYVPDRLQRTQVRPPWVPGLTGLLGVSRLLPNLSVNTCPPVFSKACVLKNNPKDDKTVADHFLC
jgi:hypothetical protein